MDRAEFKGAQNPVPPDVWTVFDPSPSRALCLTNRDSVTPTLDAALRVGGGGGGYYQSKRLGINPLWCEFAQCSCECAHLSCEFAHCSHEIAHFSRESTLFSHGLLIFLNLLFSWIPQESSFIYYHMYSNLLTQNFS